jgi:hypothetical protein
MLSSFTASSRVLLKQVNAKTFNGQTGVRLMSSLTPPTQQKEERRQVHSSTPRKADASAAAVETPAAVVKKTKAEGGLLYDRFVVTAEVTVSKIFPAGFGWQTSSIIASESFDFAPDTMNFALSTGRKCLWC